MNKSIINIGVIVLACVTTLSGYLGLQDQLNPNNRDKRNLVDEPLKLNDTIPLSGRVTPLKLKYEGKEQIHVPYGATDSYKVTSGSMTFWYSTNDRGLYQYKDGDTIYRLTDLVRDKSE